MHNARGRPPIMCQDCDKAHKHSDGAIFCSIYSFRISEGFRRPDFCVGNWNRRIGLLKKVSLDIVDKTKGILHNEEKAP